MEPRVDSVEVRPNLLALAAVFVLVYLGAVGALVYLELIGVMPDHETLFETIARSILYLSPLFFVATAFLVHRISRWRRAVRGRAGGVDVPQP